MTVSHDREESTVLLLHNGDNIDLLLKKLTVANIQNICLNKCGFPSRSTASQSAAYSTISSASRGEQESILAAARSLISEGVTRYKRQDVGQSGGGRKKKQRVKYHSISIPEQGSDAPATFMVQSSKVLGQL